MRHFIQRAGHEFLPIVFTIVGIFAALSFYLGNVTGNPPPTLVILCLVALALGTEWLTFTFNQDMQDAVSQRQGVTFAVVKALIASAVSVFIFASAGAGLWAPKGHTINSIAWAWVLAVGVFGAQFLLKLTPERPRQHSLASVALVAEQWTRGDTPEVQARKTAAMFNALAGQQVLPMALPAPAASAPAPGESIEVEYVPDNQYSGHMRAVPKATNGHKTRGSLQQPPED